MHSYIKSEPSTVHRKYAMHCMSLPVASTDCSKIKERPWIQDSWYLVAMRPKAREMTQLEGPPSWLKESDSAG